MVKVLSTRTTAGWASVAALLSRHKAVEEPRGQAPGRSVYWLPAARQWLAVTALGSDRYRLDWVGACPC
jgi:hypothetical protein